MSPFYADQGYLPNFQIKTEEAWEQITSESAAAHANKIQNIMNKLQEIMNTNKDTVGQYYDQKHEDISFSDGDWVMLKTNHIRSTRSCKKLAEKQIGPFKVIKKITEQTYQLDLNNLVGKIHDVFHVQKLEKSTEPQSGQNNYGMEWFVDDDETFKTLKDIVDSRLNNKIFEYKVIYNDGSTEWIAKDDLEEDEVEIIAFHNRNPLKPIPNNRILVRSSRSRRPPIRYSSE